MKTKKSLNKLPVMEKQCATCPFLEKGWKEVRSLLEKRALFEATPICHSTGSGALSKKRISRKPLACRGARDLQLQSFHRMGFIDAPTDLAWDKKCKELGL